MNANKVEANAGGGATPRDRATSPSNNTTKEATPLKRQGCSRTPSGPGQLCRHAGQCCAPPQAKASALRKKGAPSAGLEPSAKPGWPQTTVGRGPMQRGDNESESAQRAAILHD